MKNSGENSVDSGKTQRGFLDKSAGTRLIFELKQRGLVKMSIKVCTSLTNSSFFQRHNLDALRKSLVVFFCEYFQYFFDSFFSQVAGKINVIVSFLREVDTFLSSFIITYVQQIPGNVFHLVRKNCWPSIRCFVLREEGCYQR